MRCTAGVVDEYWNRPVSVTSPKEVQEVSLQLDAEKVARAEGHLLPQVSGRL